MRKQHYSTVAQEIVYRAYKLGEIRLFSDPDWSLLQSYLMETPIGEVHLHWMNHRGIGHWNLIQNPKRVGAICKTARCRRVIITPLGGENESADISRQRYEDAIETWANNKHLDDLIKSDVEKAMYEERKRKQKIRDIIESEYGPWPYTEKPHWHYDGKRIGQWMHELDKALAAVASQ